MSVNLYDKTSNNIKIAEALAAIMAEVAPVGKDSQNTQQGFKFRGIDAVMNHLHPVFSKHGVIVLPEVLDDKTEERTTKSGGHLIYRVLRVKFSFVASDGSTLSSIVIGEGMDSGDKAANKAMAVALKYALTQMLLLPYDEIDADADTPEPSKPATNPNPKPDPKPASKGGALISEAQRRRLFAIADHANVEPETLKNYLAKFGIEQSADIPKSLYDQVCDWAENGGQEPPDPDAQRKEGEPF